MKEQPIHADDDDIRLDRWFKRHYPGVPHAMIQKALRKGLIRLDGKKAEASTHVQAGQTVKMPEWTHTEKSAPVPADKQRPIPEEKSAWMQSLVLYKDNYLIAINKPAGLAVQGGTGQKESVDSLLPALKFDSLERPKLVHRLDKDTSGVLLLGRNARAAAELSTVFVEKTARKIYWALVIGVPEIERGEINMPLRKMELGHNSRMMPEERMEVDDKGQKALTRYRIIEKLGHTACWLELWPVTGRTHQLRVHLAEIGHPIVGDGKYGGSEAFLSGSVEIPEQMHLHARRMVIPDWHGKTLDVSAPLPPHMKQSWNALGFDEKDRGVSMADGDDF